MIVLQRHFQPQWQPQHCLGQFDANLSESGLTQAQQFAECLREEIDEIWCSDLRRASASALPIARRLGLPLKQSVLLREINMGIFTGLHWDQVHQQFPDALAVWGAEWALVGPPQGESFMDIVQRASLWRAQVDDSQRIWAVAHEGFIRAALVAWANASLEQAIARQFQYGECVQFA